MKALVFLSVLLSICSSYVLQKRSLLGGHEHQHEHHHQHHPLPHRGHQRRELLQQSGLRHNNNVQEARNARDGDLGDVEHHENHGDAEVRSAPAGYLPPSGDYDDDLTSYVASDNQAANTDYYDDDLTSYTAGDNLDGYDNQSEYKGDNVDEEESSGDDEQYHQDNQDKQSQYGLDSLEQYGEEELDQYEGEDQPGQYGDETQQINGAENLEQYSKDQYEEDPLAVGSKSPEYEPVEDIKDAYSKPIDDLYDASSEDNDIETANGSLIDTASDSYGAPGDDLNDLTSVETDVAPNESGINVVDNTYSAPSESVDNKPVDELYSAPTDGDITDTTDSIDGDKSAETDKETAPDSYNAPLDDSKDLAADEEYISPVVSDVNSPDNTYGAPLESVKDMSSDDAIASLEETDLTPPPAIDVADTEITQSDYAAPSNLPENEYLAPATSPSLEYSVLGSNVNSGLGSSSRKICPGGSIERCVTVCPGITARIYGACVDGCANRCS